MSASDLVVTKWGTRFQGRMFPSSIGRGGISSAKREGDGATPVGAHRISGLLYRADRIVKPKPWAVAIGPRDLWSDDQNDHCYNLMVRAPYAFSHERLQRADPLYDLVLVLNWNWPVAERGRGSAIFVHTWRKARHPTEGCVAFRADHLRWIVERVTPDTRVVVQP